METHKVNSLNSGKEFLRKKGKYVVNAVAILAILIMSLFSQISCQKLKNLIYDYAMGAKAVNRVETAQYIPDIKSLLHTNSVQTPTNVSLSVSQLEKSTSASEKTITNTEFVDIINEYATVDTYSGAGKYNGYDIYEIKEEIAFVIKTVPAFNQWFRMPTMREEQGFISTPYNEWWAYYLEMDQETSKLSITRISWTTRSEYYDFENNVTVEDNSDGTNFVQYQVMKINYYFNEVGDEVVDCSIYAVGVDHQLNTESCNSNENDYYPFEYIYLQHVKDKSLIKYHITAAERTKNGMDIRGRYPYGYRREFTLVNYADYGSSDIEMLQIDQYANRTIDFSLESKNITTLVHNIGLPQEDYTSENSPSSLLNNICKHIVDNFELKNNWPAIYKESMNAYKISEVEGPFYGKPLPINDVSIYVSCRDFEKNGIEFDADANILDISKFDLKKQYSLSMALRSKNTGNLYIIGTDYQYIQEVEYNYSDDYQGVKDTYFRLTGISIDILFFKLEINEPGEYDLTCVLTVKENGEDVIVFDTLQVAYLRQYFGLEIPDYTDSNGIKYSYTASGICGKLTITVTQMPESENT